MVRFLLAVTIFAANFIFQSTILHAASANVDAQAATSPQVQNAANYKEGEFQKLYSPNELNKEEDFWSFFRRPQTTYTLGSEASFFRYDEPDFASEEGWMYGLTGNITHHISENQNIHSLADVFSDTNKVNVYRLEGRFSLGEMDYDGSGVTEGVDDYMFEGRAVAGYDIPLFSNVRVTPYAGFGYRYLNDDSSGKITSDGSAGYERESRYLYIPLALEVEFHLAQSWALQLTPEYDIFAGGKQISHLGDAVRGLNTIENDQESGYGLKGSVRLTKETDNMDFFVESFVRYWNIEDSQISLITFNGVAVGYGLEPKNNSTEYGFKIGINF